MNRTIIKKTTSMLSRKWLAFKMTLRFIILAIMFEIAYVLIHLLFLIVMGVTNLDQTYAFMAFKPFILPILIIGSFVGCGYMLYRFMLRPLQHLEDVAKAAQQLAPPTDVPIILPGNLKGLENDLNHVREQSLQSLQHARQIEQRKEDLLIYLAHDLKTPLTSILGYLKLLEDEPNISPELIQKYSGIARKKAERLQDLINEFFEITRFSTHQLSLEPAKTHLSRMLMQITYEFYPILVEKGLEWELQIPENIEIVCDADKLERAIDNLIRNAINYSYSNTKISFSLLSTDTGVTICIQNAGQTIPPEKLERIFEQFYRLDTSRSSATGNAGLGLAIAREIIELHCGTITAHSKDETIQFVIQLPFDSKTHEKN